VAVTGTGVTDFANGDGEISFTSSATGNFSDRFIYPLFYIELPTSERPQNDGKPWAEVNLNTVAEAKMGASLSQLSSSAQEPTEVLSYLQAVSTNGIKALGPATIRGTRTAGYSATIDLTKLANQKSPQLKATVLSLEQQIHTSKIPVQVWLDAQGRVRQITDQVSASGANASAVSADVGITVDYYDFGTPVSVSPPPPAQVDNVTSQVANAATPSS
jgi:hypothetical protein